MPGLQTAPRIEPLLPPYEPQTAAELKKWMPPGAPIEPLKLFRTLARNRPMAEAMRSLGSYILGRQLSLTLRERELIIDRTCARCGCEYEWGVHVEAFGRRAGMSDAQLLATARRAIGDDEWTEADLLLIRLVDELHDIADVSDGLWDTLAERWSAEQILEMVVVAGWYHIISYVANAARVDREDWARSLQDKPAALSRVVQ